MIAKFILAPLIAEKIGCSTQVSEDFTIHLHFVNNYDDVKIYKPFHYLIDSKFEVSWKKKKKNKDQKSNKKPEILTQYNMGIIKQSPENVLQKFGMTAIDIGVCE
jgi:hypothetical protein